MNTSHEERQLCWRPVLLVLPGWLTSGGCLPKSIPLASLPMKHPMATNWNLTGIDPYQAGHWMETFEWFDAALQIDPDSVEAPFYAGLALNQVDRHEEATRHIRWAVELDPRNAAVVHFRLYRNHPGLSSTLKRHLSGGYRYQH